MKQTPQIMGVLNVTPDSFYDGGQHDSLDAAIEHGHRLVADGADLLDIGGESSRPYSSPVSEAEELGRVIPVIKTLAPDLGVPISIDTRRASVAEAALHAGAQMVNDISGCQDPKMRLLLVESGASVCVMHMQGKPSTMQDDPRYPDGVVATIDAWFERQIEELLDSGVKESQIILDPGIGFGKRVEHNLEILRNLRKFRRFGLPLLVGASRKGFMQKILKKPTQNLLSATLAVHTLALAEQVEFIRVHDVVEHRDAVTLFSALYGQNKSVQKPWAG